MIQKLKLICSAMNIKISKIINSKIEKNGARKL